MTITKTRTFAALVAACALAITGCGDDDDTSTDDAAGIEETADDTAGESSDDDGAGDDGATDEGGDEQAPTGGGGGGTLVFDGEEIALDGARCFLEEQEAAAGGGSIEFVAQGSGTNAAGEEVALDVSRYSEESQFAGDDVTIDIGPLMESVGYSGKEPAGTVTVDGNVVSAEGFPVLSSEDMSEVTVSFTINC